MRNLPEGILWKWELFSPSQQLPSTNISSTRGRALWALVCPWWNFGYLDHVQTLCGYAVHIRRAHMLWRYEHNTHAVNRRHHVIAVLPILWLSFLLPPFSDVPWAWWVDIDALFMVWHWLPLMANILISHGSLHWPWSRARRPFSDHGQEQARWIGISIHIQPADQHLTSHVVKIITPMKSESIEFLIYGYFPRRVELSSSVS